MDKRGFTVDPNRDPCAELSWYEKIGPTQRPSPYSTASWVYLQKYVVELVDACGVETSIGFDNYRDFNVWLYDFVLNGGEFYQQSSAFPVYDGGTVFNTPFIKHIFATVKVYDSLASYPGDYGDQDVKLGLLGIDSEQDPSEVPEVISPEALIGFDNGNNILIPIPNPQAVYDGGLFSQQGLGITLDGLQFQIVDDTQQIVAPTNAVYIDGSLVEGDGEPNGLDFLELSRTAVSSDDVSPGKILGEINYEVLDCKIRITDWSHYNWMDDTPVRKAFKAIVNSLPTQISKDNISVRDNPHAFWTSLGFVQRNKGDETLYYKDPKKIRPY